MPKPIPGQVNNTVSLLSNTTQKLKLWASSKLLNMWPYLRAVLVVHKLAQNMFSTPSQNIHLKKKRSNNQLKH